MSNVNTTWVPEFSEAAVLITGGTSGVGFETARQFAEGGVTQIGLIEKNEKRGKKAKKKLLKEPPDITASFMAADVKDAEQAHEAVNKPISDLGSVDILETSPVGA